jgi:hypothetical protein
VAQTEEFIPHLPMMKTSELVPAGLALRYRPLLTRSLPPATPCSHGRLCPIPRFGCTYQRAKCLAKGADTRYPPSGQRPILHVIGCLRPKCHHYSTSKRVINSKFYVEFAHQDQPAVGGDPGTLEIDLERGVEGELKGSIMYLTPWVLASGASSSRLHPHEY